ncbi:MAG: PHP domain-containing protein [Dehalococcoidia bacterium]|nr:PHP domain-containing protein [Chloroflexota bacterium]MCK4242030.1 PHP domain-containing protein [Dehalococcoidia bacterium]
MLKADLHVHTSYSPDSKTSLQQVIARCKEIEIGCVAITDHNTILGALKLREIAPFTVIVGEEINTRSGEIIGYFLTEEIPAMLPAEETVRRIKEQGGLVCIPHPFDRLRTSALRRRTLEALLPEIDIIEVFNSRVLLSRHNLSARLFAQDHGLLASAGSDAHIASEIGGTCVVMPEFNDREEFRLALAQGVLVCHKASLWVHLWSIWARLEGRIKRR